MVWNKDYNKGTLWCDTKQTWKMPLKEIAIVFRRFRGFFVLQEKREMSDKSCSIASISFFTFLSNWHLTCNQQDFCYWVSQSHPPSLFVSFHFSYIAYIYIYIHGLVPSSLQASISSTFCQMEEHSKRWLLTPVRLSKITPTHLSDKH